MCWGCGRLSFLSLLRVPLFLVPLSLLRVPLSSARRLPARAHPSILPNAACGVGCRSAISLGFDYRSRYPYLFENEISVRLRPSLLAAWREERSRRWGPRRAANHSPPSLPSLPPPLPASESPPPPQLLVSLTFSLFLSFLVPPSPFGSLFSFLLSR